MGFVAGLTGLEPATSGLTGRRSNQLNYSPFKIILCIIRLQELQLNNLKLIVLEKLQDSENYLLNH